MSLIMTIAGLKGGVGKSTISLNVATCLHRAGHQTLVVDCDPQGTCRTWAAKAAENGHDGPPVVSIEGQTLRRDLDRIASAFEAVVIDTPPRMATETRAAMLIADLVVMPVVPGAADMWALNETVEVLKDAQTMRPELVGVTVANRIERTTLSQLTGTAVAKLGTPVMKSTLGNRVAFGEATLVGRGVVDYAPSSPAASEIKALAAELLAFIGEHSHDEEG